MDEEIETERGENNLSEITQVVSGRAHAQHHFAIAGKANRMGLGRNCMSERQEVRAVAESLGPEGLSSDPRLSSKSVSYLTLTKAL